jgi:phospholipid/cholesterol/gamma-HCH transport system substrate-binding protein
MKLDRKTEIKVGLVSVAALVLLILGITLGKDFNMTVSQETIKLSFPNSGGIVPSAPVVVNGVKRGTVMSVKNAEGRVIITADLDNTADLRADATAMITMLEITGGKKIEIYPGDSDKKYTSDMIIKGSTSADISDLVTMVGEVSGEAKILLAKLDTTLTSVNYLLKDRQMLDKLDRTISNADKSLTTLSKILDHNHHKLNRAVDDLAAISSDVRGLVGRNDSKIDSLLSRLDRTSVELDKLVPAARSAISGADTLMTSMNSIATDLRTGDGLASRLIYDDEFSAKLDSLIDEVYLFVKQVRKYGINTNVSLGSEP